MPTDHKQNRCTQHKQQIVALCIDDECTQKIKAVCPLQLYNNHLDHKFENIEKIHSEWILYTKDIKQIAQNISKQKLSKYMDNIIDELINKIKQHLFLIRKQFQLKMNVYYHSKPVEKISIALKGINKCLEQKYLQLTHQEIENAKFFIDIYGIKKLINDTMVQKNNFQKQILIAFAKIKEQMFMDYPKFNALVKAKQYEYCEIIKQQKIQIQILKQRLNEIDGGYTKITQQHKQLTYQLGRTNNELKNKQITLIDIKQKLQVVMKKYNDQAQQAIIKAKEIKTKNIFGTYVSQYLHRISDRIIRTGTNQMQWPNFIDIGEIIIGTKIWIKLNRFDVGSWVLIGLMDYNRIKRNQFIFDNYKNLGHGTYLLDNNRWCYSDTNQQYNCQPLGFQFGQDDILKIQTFEKIIRFTKIIYGWDENKFQLPYTNNNGNGNNQSNIHIDNKLYYCIAIKGQNTQVQLV